MEQREPEGSNEARVSPPTGPQPDHTPPTATQSPVPQQANQPGNGQRATNQRENRQPNNRNETNRNGRNDGSGQREPHQRTFTQRDNNQRTNRNDTPPNKNPSPANDRDRSQGNRERNSPERDSRPESPAVRDSGDQGGQVLDNTGRDERLIIGISLGDYNGIGPEVILKALQYNRLQKICTPVIYGSMRVLNRYRNLLNFKDWNLNGAQTIHQISHKMTNVITCWPDQNQDIQPGQVTPEAGQAAFACLQRAVDDLKAGKLDALVTAPINKYNIQSEEFKFPGHTEYLAQEFDVADNLMFMVSERLRVGVVTGHVPLGRVRQHVTRERITQKLSLMMQSLKEDFGIEKPKIAVLGLNPHAGEEGLLGDEEQEIIKPLLADWKNKGHLVFGPYPADGFFGTRGYTKFDAVLAMYHDQGLIPFKSIAFEEGVNFTAGMPVVRTSPDHGTAYDIAGKNLADETSMLQAIYTAVDVARQRKEHAELEANALK
ncbi:4-hydroxythreonine-4-phosphate dehydrogenase PdxA [Spirosoma fluminis]